MDTFFTSTVLQNETYIFIIFGVVLKQKYLFAWKKWIYLLNGTPKAFYIYTYFRLIMPINIFEGLDTIFTKEVSSNTDIPDTYEIEMLK